MIPFTQEQKVIHERALKISSEYQTKETELIDVLSEVDRTQLFKKLNCPSLFKYAVDILGLSEAISYALISIARKSREVPALRRAGLSVSKASRIVSILNRENAAELIRFAKTHTSKQIESEVARRNPKAASRDRVKMISGDAAQLTITVSAEFLEMLKRVESLEGKRSAPAIEAALRVYLKHKDPVQKAQRAQKKSELCVRRVRSKKPNHSKRIPLSAAQSMRSLRVI